ncbi:MAG: flagellar basal body-associated FliL family protein [Turicibacter sp.]|nr:flagellar basal body-associated FliL family protein [Turicibacter sp.]
MSKQATEENQPKSSSKFRIGVIIVGLIAVLQLGILFVVFKEPIMTTITGLIPEKEVIVVDFPLPSMQVNLANKDREVFLRTTVNLQCSGEEGSALIETNLNKIQAKVIEILRSKTLEQINTIEKTHTFADEIKDELNQLLGEEAISGVLFVEFLYQ